MLHINDYLEINENITLLNSFLNESLLFHIGIELNEEYGEFSENHNISLFIAHKINNLYKRKIYQKDFIVYPKDIDCDVYFNKLNISYIVGDHYNFRYIYVSDVETDIFIQIPKNYKLGELQKGISHEFQHYFEDLILIGKGLKSFENIFDKNSEYGMLYHRAKNFNDHRIPISGRNIRLALYVLDEFEQHGFIASLCEQINQLKDHNKYLINKLTPNDIFKIIKDTEEYKVFANLINIFDDYKKNKLSTKELSIIGQEWFKLTGKKEDNIDTIFNSLISKLKKAIKKINNVLPKKIIESLNISYIN